MIPSTMLGLPSCILRIISDSIPRLARNSWVPCVALILKPNLANCSATSYTAGRSLGDTVIKMVPSEGSNCCAATCALKKASPKESAIPSTSPVERISGPRTGSTSGNMLNGKTASLTPKYGIIRDLRPSSSSFLPNISWVATLAMETLQTFDTSGTVREARGLASSTYTTLFAMAYWIFIRPTTLSSLAILLVYSLIVSICP